MYLYHVTDNPNFMLSDAHAPQDMLLAVDDHPQAPWGYAPPGSLFATINISGNFWTDIASYRTPFFVVVLVLADWVHDEDIIQGRWFPDEIIVTNPRALRVERIVSTMRCNRGDRWDASVRCDGRINPWGSMCSSCRQRHTPVPWRNVFVSDEAMFA